MARRIAACTACGLWKTCRSVCVPPDGPVDAEVVFVGEAPGAEEDLKNKPFIGASGEMLRSRIEKYIPERRVRISNVVRCRPPGNRTPTPQEAQVCTEKHLEGELKIRPKLIVAVGLLAVRTLTGKRGILKYAGQVLPSEYGPVFVLPHPSYVLRNRGCEKEWENTWRKLPKVIDPPDQSLLDYRLLRSEIDVAELLKSYGDKPVAFDYETDCISPWEGGVKSVAVCAEEGTAFCFDPNVHKKAWVRFLRGPAKKIAHNYAFEGVWSKVHFGSEPKNVHWDTKLASKLFDENTPHGLKDLAVELTPLGDYAREEKGVIGGEDWKDKTIQDVWKYNCFDADATLRVYLAQRQREDNGEPISYLLSKSLAHVQVLNRARVRGIHVDVQAFDSVEKDLQKEEKDALAEMRKSTVVRVFEKQQGKPLNINSPKQTRELLVGYLGVTPTAFSRRTGQAKMDKNFLEKVKDQHPAINHLLRARKAYKARTTTLVHLKKFTVGRKVHTQWNVGQAATWRISSSNPPMQNNSKIPKIRNLFIAPPGYVLVEMDYSQIELRVLASLTGEPSMVEAYQAGRDIHTETASKVYGLPAEEIDTEKRARAKSINFGTIYGIQEFGLEEKFGIPLTEGRRMLEAFWKAHPSVQKWVEEQKDYAVSRGYVESAYGRRRHFPENVGRGDKHAMNQAVNFPVQATAAEMCLDALTEIEAECPGFVVGQVHDSILFYVKEDFLPEKVGLFREVMERQGEDFMRVPVVVDTKVGPSWGKMEEWSDA